MFTLYLTLAVGYFSCMSDNTDELRKRKISVDMFIFEATVCQQISLVKYLVHVNVLVHVVHNRI